MCKKLTALYVENLGNRRIGWCLWNGCEAVGMTDNQIRKHIENGGIVNGLKVGDDGSVVPDDLWGGVMLAKSGINSFAPLEPDADLVATKSFSLISVIKDGKQYQYEFITNRFGREIMGEDKVKALLTLMPLGGGCLIGNKLSVHKDVIIVEKQSETAER